MTLICLEPETHLSELWKLLFLLCGSVYTNLAQKWIQSWWHTMLLYELFPSTGERWPGVSS
jgi:hypothetical protein